MMKGGHGQTQISYMTLTRPCIPINVMLLLLCVCVRACMCVCVCQWRRKQLRFDMAKVE